MLTSSFRVFRNPVLPVGAVVVASAIGLSAHVIRSVDLVTEVRAFVSSPSSGVDAPIPILWPTADPAKPLDTGLRIACFYVANSTSPDPADPAWPRITSVGVELPGSPSGFSLLEPLDGGWQLSESVQRSLGSKVVTLDFAIVAGVNPIGGTPGSPDDPRGIPPGQAAVRRSGTRFCVSGPFPDRLPDLSTTDIPDDTVAATIENLITGVVVGFHGVAGQHQGVDMGVSPTIPPTTIPRPIPMYP